MWSAAARRLVDGHLPGCRIQAAVDPILAGEPQPAFEVEYRGVEVGVLAAGGKREVLHLFGLGVDPHDGVEPTIGHPGVAVWTNDHPVRRRAWPEAVVPATAQAHSNGSTADRTGGK